MNFCFGIVYLPEYEVAYGWLHLVGHHMLMEYLLVGHDRNLNIQQQVWIERNNIFYSTFIFFPEQQQLLSNHNNNIYWEYTEFTTGILTLTN